MEAVTVVPAGAKIPFTVAVPMKMCGGTDWAEATAGNVSSRMTPTSKARTLALVIDSSFSMVYRIAEPPERRLRIRN
jgi:hypothetical protein